MQIHRRSSVCFWPRCIPGLYRAVFVCGRGLGAAPGYRSCADQMDLLFHEVLEYEIVQVCSTQIYIIYRNVFFSGLNVAYL